MTDFGAGGGRERERESGDDEGERGWRERGREVTQKIKE